MWFGKWHEEYGFFPEHSRLGFWWDALINLKKYELKIHKGVICHDNELSKIWIWTDLSFQSRHEDFDEFWPEHLKKVSKIFILIGSFWAKYMLFEVKKYRQVIFHETEEGSKIWRGIDLSFQNWHKEFDKFWAEHSKVSKVFTLISSQYICQVWWSPFLTLSVIWL